MRKRLNRFSGYFNQATETMSRGEREEYHNHLLREITTYAYRHSPRVRETFRAVAITPEDIQSVRHLEKVPITEKASLISLQKKTHPLADS
jgi:phenylacetate-CoA ligase